MNRKILIIITTIIILLCLIIFISSFIKNNKYKNSTNYLKTTTNENKLIKGKVLIVYFSAQNHTKKVAEVIANKLNADTFEIIPVEKYTEEDLDWTNNDSRVSREHNDKSLRNIKLVTTEVENWDSYNTVLIGYPIWWAVAAWPVDTFVKENDFNGKIVIPFCTSASSGLGESGEILSKEANGGTWLEGKGFNSNPTDSEIENWLKSIN